MAKYRNVNKQAIYLLMQRGVLPSEFSEVSPQRAQKKMTATQQKKFDATVARIRKRRAT